MAPTAPDGDGTDPGLPEFLRSSRAHLASMFDEYHAGADQERSGTLVKAVVRDLARLDAARDATLRQALRDLDGGGDRLARYDEARQARGQIFEELDDATNQVGSRDVHVADGEGIRGRMSDLHDALCRYGDYESEELIPFLESKLDGAKLEDLGRRAMAVSRHGPTHAHPTKRPADERSTLANAWTALGDRLRDKEHLFGKEDEALDSAGRSGLNPDHPLADEDHPG